MKANVVIEAEDKAIWYRSHFRWFAELWLTQQSAEKPVIRQEVKAVYRRYIAARREAWALRCPASAHQPAICDICGGDGYDCKCDE